jgi:hypothetical protein
VEEIVMKRFAIRSLLLVLGLSGTALPALATQIIQQPPQQLAKDAALIVDGTVSSVRSYWNNDHTRILTETTVTVGSTHKGAAASSVRVMQPGGVVGNVRQTAHGALQWKRGEEVLLFLEPAQAGAYQVAGFSQGKYVIERDARTGRAYIEQAMPPAGAGPSSSSGAVPASAGKVTLEQFLNQVMPKK